MAEPPEHLNAIHLIGRLSQPAEPRELPSGDTIVAWRLVVDRPGGGQDTLDCTAWTGRLKASALRWARGDTLEITGSLHRRFWKVGSGLASRYDVAVTSARRIAGVDAGDKPRRVQASA